VAERTAELAEAHGFLNLVLDSSTEYAIVATDLKRRITLFNRGAERMFGFTAAEAAGQTPSDLLGLREEGQLKEALLRSVQDADAGAQHQAEVTFRRAGGEEFPASLTVTAIRQSDGNVIGRLAVIKDLTAEREGAEQLRLMQERLARQEKIAALGRAAAQVAHEVRNPLAGLLLYSMHLRSKAAGTLPESELALVDKIITTVNHLTDTVEQVLNFARPVNLAPRAADLNRVVSDVLHLLESQVSAKRIEQRLELDERGCPGLIDEASVRSALLNLILNAVQAMPDGGTLTIRTGADGDGPRVEITDTGRGMTPEQLEHVFEPFYTTKSQGLGLGMPYARKVVEQHGGTISVESAAGEGTTIRVALPGGAEVN
jgi:PAS domain S-box-containing protein